MNGIVYQASFQLALKAGDQWTRGQQPDHICHSCCKKTLLANCTFKKSREMQATTHHYSLLASKCAF